MEILVPCREKRTCRILPNELAALEELRPDREDKNTPATPGGNCGIDAP